MARVVPHGVALFWVAVQYQAGHDDAIHFGIPESREERGIGIGNYNPRVQPRATRELMCIMTPSIDVNTLVTRRWATSGEWNYRSKLRQGIAIANELGLEYSIEDVGAAMDLVGGGGLFIGN